MNRIFLSITVVPMMLVSSCVSCQDLPIEVSNISPVVALASLVDRLGEQVTQADAHSLLSDVPYALSEDIFNCLPVTTIDSRFFSFFRFTPRYQPR